jgi:hypothetical protein
LGIEKREGNLTVPLVCCSEHYKLENSTSVAQNTYSREVTTEQNRVQSTSFTYLLLQGSGNWTTVQRGLKIVTGLHGREELGRLLCPDLAPCFRYSSYFFLVGTIPGSTHLPRRSAPSLSLRGYFRRLA